MNKKQQLFVIICFATAVVSLLLLISSLVGCDDGCATGDTRCKDDTVQLCDADSRWHDYAECSTVSVFVDGGLVDMPMICCVSEGESSCELPDDCGFGDQ